MSFIDDFYRQELAETIAETKDEVKKKKPLSQIHTGVSVREDFFAIF